MADHLSLAFYGILAAEALLTVGLAMNLWDQHRLESRMQRLEARLVDPEPEADEDVAAEPPSTRAADPAGAPQLPTGVPPGPGATPRHRTPSGGGDLARSLRLFRRFKGSSTVYVVGLGLLAFEALTSVVEPYPIAYLIDFLQGTKPALQALGAPALISSPRFDTLLLLTVAIVLIAAVNSAADSLTEVCMARGGRSLGYSVRIAMYSHLQRLPLAYHDKKRTGDVLTRVTGDVLVLEDFVVKSISNILGSLLVLVGSFAFLLYQSWKVAVVALFVVPLLAGVSDHYSRRIKAASKTQRDREGDLASTAQEMLTSIRLVQSYGRGTVDLEKFSNQTGRSMHASLGAANVEAQFSFVIALIEALAISAVVWLGVWLFDRDVITIGTLVLFVLLLQNMFKPARKIVSEWYKIGKVFASVERIEDLLEREVGVRDLPGAVTAPPLEGRLSFRHVSFTYPDEHEDGSRVEGRPPVLNDIDFDVAPGEVVALVGSSGAGKSTIAQLVPRLYDPDGGEVLVDGHPVRELTLASLRSQVSVVLQETVLLSGTVAENIGYGIDGATAAEIEAAARMANAHEFIMEMPDGYATTLGERGSTLSGGQRQRIAIARAFIRRAPILILDEPTTGLDQESARSVVSALLNLMRGTTTIVISHDRGLIQCADRVLVVAQGRIVQGGRQEVLLHSEGPDVELYAEDVIGRLAPSSAPSPTGQELLEPLLDRLPGLAMALDVDVAAEQVQRMLSRGATVDAISIGKLWLRDDGTCDLRYRLRLSGPEAPGDATVLARVHRSAPAAEEGLRRALQHLAPSGSSTSPPPGWRAGSAVVPDAALTLHRFPADPNLPTLAGAMHARTLSTLAPFAAWGDRTAASVVHHPRDGACVLRYDLVEEDDGPLPAPPPPIYGKVYRDGHGDVVDGFLRALTREQTVHGSTYPARFPTSLGYSPDLRLLVTEGLAGEPLVPRLLKAVAGPAPDGTASHEALVSAVEQSGLALAALHGSDVATAPVHSAADDLADLRRQLTLVAGVWPEVTQRVRRRVDVELEQVPQASDIVLSHGDFTPSQVLLGAGGPAVVDFDTLCWADPALDLGRYLAQLELLAAKAGRPPASDLVADLTQAFLGAYAASTHRTAAGAAAVDRIAFYRVTTLARSALRSCRQGKAYRLELALSLLDVSSGRVDL
jgi:ABC-type multidrug transport system fused ATPase/permease subunit